MRARRVDFDLLERGVWQASWLGPDGELVLVAVTSKHRLLVPPVTVPHGASRIQAADELVAQLDREDPRPALKIIRA